MEEYDPLLFQYILNWIVVGVLLFFAHKGREEKNGGVGVSW